MMFLYILLIASGALPMMVFLIKRKRYRYILHNGTKTSAQIISIRTSSYNRGSHYDRVSFAYLPAGASRYFQGDFIAKVGKYKRGAYLDIYYLPQDPQRNAVPGSKGEAFMFIFLVLLLLFTIFASFKIHEMVGREGVTYTFKPPWKQ